MTERTRILEKLSPSELLMYVAAGGGLVTRRMELCYAKALVSVGLQVAPTAAQLAAIVAEGMPRGRRKPQRPLVYRPYAAAKTGRPKGVKRNRRAA